MSDTIDQYTQLLLAILRASGRRLPAQAIRKEMKRQSVNLSLNNVRKILAREVASGAVDAHGGRPHSYTLAEDDNAKLTAT